MAPPPAAAVLVDPSGRKWQRAIVDGRPAVTPLEPPHGKVYEYDARAGDFVERGGPRLPAQAAPTEAPPREGRPVPQ